MILLIDNYDSFTYNLVQRLGEIDPGLDLRVVRNDQVTLEEIESAGPSRLIISPGPCTPREAGISNESLSGSARYPVARRLPGPPMHRAYPRRRVVRADRIMHGKTSWIHHDGRGSIAACPTRSRPPAITAWSSSRAPCPEDLEIVAWTDEGEIMGVRHQRYPIEGVQFHPESFLTLEGIELLRNFLVGP